MSHKLTITHISDEEVSYKLNGTHLLTANHDDDGWSGMERVNSMMMAVAKEIGAEVETKED